MVTHSPCWIYSIVDGQLLGPFPLVLTCHFSCSSSIWLPVCLVLVCLEVDYDSIASTMHVTELTQE